MPEPNGRKTDRRRFSNLANPENADIDSIVKEEKEISDFYQDLSILLLVILRVRALNLLIFQIIFYL